MTAAVTDPDLLVDRAGTGPQGLDRCELASGPVLARSGLSIDYTSTPFAEMARLVEGDRVELAGQDAVVNRGRTACFVHTYLWETDAEGRGTVHAEAVARAADCREARDLTRVVIEGAAGEPARGGQRRGPGRQQPALTYAPDGSDCGEHVMPGRCSSPALWTARVEPHVGRSSPHHDPTSPRASTPGVHRVSDR